jgi:hypothetical protein
MTTTYTPNRNYSLPATGDDINTWGPVLNANFTAIDKNISGGYGISTTGGTTVLNTTQSANLEFGVSGTLTSNAIVEFPFVATFFFGINGTTGAYTLTFSAAGGGATATLAQGSNGVFWTDGTSVYKISSNETASPVIPSGTIMMFLQASAPTGWTQVTSINDCTIKLINNGTGGQSSGSWTISGLSTTRFYLSQADLPNVTLPVNGGTLIGGSGGNINTGSYIGYSAGGTTGSLNGGVTQTYIQPAVTQDGSWRPLAINTLVASKN